MNIKCKTADILLRVSVLSLVLVSVACTSPVSNGPYVLGNDSQGSDQTALAAGTIHWIKIDVPRKTTIQSLSIIAQRWSGTTAANVRMSVYTDDASGFADAFVADSDVQNTLTGDMQLLTFDVAATDTAAGSYWVGVNSEVDVKVASDHSLSAEDICYQDSVLTSDNWPASVSPSRSSDSENNLSVYMTVID